MLLHLISVSTLLSKMNDCTRAHIHFWPHSTIWLLFAHVLCQHINCNQIDLFHNIAFRHWNISWSRNEPYLAPEKIKPYIPAQTHLLGNANVKLVKKNTETLQSNKYSVSRLLPHRRVFWTTSWRLKKPPPRQNQIQLILLGNQSWPHGIQLAQNRMLTSGKPFSAAMFSTTFLLANLVVELTGSPLTWASQPLFQQHLQVVRLAVCSSTRPSDLNWRLWA
jgi:hypothetical protein